MPPKSYLLGRAIEEDHPAVCLHNTTPVTGIGRTFVVVAPWCDQGVGVQARTYVHWLRRLGHAVVVFACAPTKTPKGAPERMQADPAEWGGVEVHYSPHRRDAVPLAELTTVAQTHHATDALMVEVARKHAYQLSWALHNKLGIRVFAVPNIEMVQRDELHLMQRMPFHRILCSNAYTHATLKFFGVDPKRLALLPFALPDVAGLPRAEPHPPGEPVKFLLVGGLNAERRKQASRVIAAFVESFGHPMQWPAATLTVLAQGPLRVPESLPGNVQVIREHLSHTDVLVHYASHHVVIVASRAEGVGIGFHEAMRAGCAVITLDTALFKEMVSPEINGWLVPAEIEPAKTADRSIGVHNTIVSTHTFSVHALAAALRLAVTGAVETKQYGARRAYEELYSEPKVLEAYEAALSPCTTA